MKLLGIVFLSIASIAVFVGMVLPVGSRLIPNFWARSGKVYLSFVSLGFPLVVFGWSISLLEGFVPSTQNPTPKWGAFACRLFISPIGN